MKTITILVALIFSAASGAKNMTTQKANLAGGCFWGMEELIRALPGVTKTVVGYTGGSIDNPTYKIVSLGTSNHTESIEVEFDPSKLSYKSLIEFFFRIHDPTTVNQQGNDKGTQYRSAIFYNSEEEKNIANEVINKVNASKKWPKPIVTEVTKFTKFYPAEEYHQDYLQKNPSGYTCHWVRN